LHIKENTIRNWIEKVIFVTQMLIDWIFLFEFSKIMQIQTIIELNWKYAISGVKVDWLEFHVLNFEINVKTLRNWIATMQFVAQKFIDYISLFCIVQINANRIKNWIENVGLIAQLLID
jgi:hypothetical protein